MEGFGGNANGKRKGKGKAKKKEKEKEKEKEKGRWDSPADGPDDAAVKGDVEAGDLDAIAETGENDGKGGIGPVGLHDARVLAGPEVDELRVVEPVDKTDGTRAGGNHRPVVVMLGLFDDFLRRLGLLFFLGHLVALTAALEGACRASSEARIGGSEDDEVVASIANGFASGSLQLLRKLGEAFPSEDRD